MEWFDAGVNLTHTRLHRQLESVITRAHAAGVSHQLVIATDIAEAHAAIELCERFPDSLYTTVGVHPHEADNAPTDLQSQLFELAQSPFVKAIGECGLDFNRNFASSANQKRVFIQQIEVANELSLPLYLHERDALEEQISLLDRYAKPRLLRLTHCFTGGHKALDAYNERGHCFGLTGWLCDERRNQELLSVLPALPKQRTVLETDAPFLLPRNIRPRPRDNEPAYLPYVGEALAESWCMSVAEVAQLTTANALRLFALDNYSS